jgi:hypothetical protein
MTKASSLPPIERTKPPVTAQKGEAGVSTPSPVAPAPQANSEATTPTETLIPSMPTPTQNPPSDLQNVEAMTTKSMTVKIDGVSYKKLKTHGLNLGKTSQDIFVEALALYFKANKI